MSTITFPRSRVLQFYKDNPTWRESGQRLGQAFHNYMELYKITSTAAKDVCDRLWEANSDVACRIIIDHTDWDN